MFSILCLALLLQSEHKEIIYQAEVFGKVDQGLDTLRNMLATAETQQAKLEVVRAMGIIKHPAGSVAIDRMGRDLDEVLQRPRALLHFRGISYLLVGGVWLEPGDWLEDYYVRDISHSTLELARLDGNLRPLSLSGLPLPTTTDYLVLADAAIRDVLTFIAERAELNVFLGSNIAGEISGTYPISSWLILLGEMCPPNQISFTRDHDNIIFVRRDDRAPTTTRRVVPAQERKVQDLFSFLQDLADAAGLELDFDDALSGEMVESRHENLPWDQILECLAISNNFAWRLSEEQGENRRLVVQKLDNRD